MTEVAARIRHTNVRPESLSEVVKTHSPSSDQRLARAPR